MSSWNAARNDCLMRFPCRYYLSYNTALVKLLKKLSRPIPQWLKEELSNNI